MPIIAPKTYNAFVAELCALVGAAVRRDGNYYICVSDGGKLTIENDNDYYWHRLISAGSLAELIEGAMNGAFGDSKNEEAAGKMKDAEEYLRSCYEEYRFYCSRLSAGKKGSDGIDKDELNAPFYTSGYATLLKPSA